ncbi:unnamed protein product [Parascedosporium putredinis]|uniref:DNA-binding protein RAP1 n=1 Tax=Parascedosporium putredinis TaxID=1442378 RepID=A0A9P1ME10_9PEZI|nr:unnamed protein product [Parascedosporium putredinis]CAI8003738.1 unnamed protein product [Parascedosporium putredinis]
MEPSRNHRTPFSLADDVLLAAWVAKKENSGGNKIYQQLEVGYPHHSWQSWRDRWMKKLRLLPPETLERMAADAPQYLDGLVTSTPEASHPQQAASESVSGPTPGPTGPASSQGPSPRQSTQTARPQAVAP